MKDFTSAFDVSTPTYREGQYRNSDQILMKSGKRSLRSKSTKTKSWISDEPAAPSKDDETSKDDLQDAEKKSAENAKKKIASSSISAESIGGDESANKSVDVNVNAERGGKAKDNKAKPSGSTESLIESENQDPYLRYLQHRLQAELEFTPASKVTAKFQIQADGVIIIKSLEASGLSFNRFSNLLIRAAPYKVPPADKKNSFSAEIPAGGSSIKVDYSD
jgi:hypothetical protein